MLKLVDKIEKKLDEYDITVYDHYEVENSECTIIAENMLIAVHDEKTIGVSFQVSTKPEIVGNFIMILGEIKGIKDIRVMESFAFTEDKKLVCGEKAHDLFDKTTKHNIIKDFETEKYYKMLLMAAKGHEC